jgi:tetratricopeptide (TPR) repeat protein
MAQSPIVQRLVDEWTQCRFRQVEKEIAQIAEGELPEDDYFRLQLLRSQALFELHRVSEAKALLQSLTTIEPKHSNNFLYALARLTYIDQDMAKAKRLFTTLLDRAESAEEYFNASLGLGYILIHENRYFEASKIQRELEELCDSVSLDKALGYHLFSAQIVFGLDDNADKAWEIYRTVIRIAGSKSWTYWTIKALYGLAVMEKTLGRLESARTIVNLMKSYLTPEETVFQNYLVNLQFTEQAIGVASPITFDTARKQIKVQGDDWLSLHDKAIIFNFLYFLHKQEKFAGKAQIARHLWPEEAYVPKLHDPRIFDIAKRTKKMIERYERQPVLLLSGRLGYKLTSNYNNHSEQADEAASSSVAEPANLAAVKEA